MGDSVHTVMLDSALLQTGIFHIFVALIFTTLMLVTFQDLILSNDPHSF